MDAYFREWVESMGVASGWKIWVRLECRLVGVAIRRYIDILNNSYFSQLHLYYFFLAAASLLVSSFLNVFFPLFMLFLCNIAKVAQRTFKIIQKSGSREYN